MMIVDGIQSSDIQNCVYIVKSDLLYVLDA